MKSALRPARILPNGIGEGTLGKLGHHPIDVGYPESLSRKNRNPLRLNLICRSLRRSSYFSGVFFIIISVTAKTMAAAAFAAVGNTANKPAKCSQPSLYRYYIVVTR